MPPDACRRSLVANYRLHLVYPHRLRSFYMPFLAMFADFSLLIIHIFHFASTQILLILLSFHAARPPPYTVVLWAGRWSVTAIAFVAILLSIMTTRFALDSVAGIPHFSACRHFLFWWFIFQQHTPSAFDADIAILRFFWLLATQRARFRRRRHVVSRVSRGRLHATTMSRSAARHIDDTSQATDYYTRPTFNNITSHTGIRKYGTAILPPRPPSPRTIPYGILGRRRQEGQWEIITSLMPAASRSHASCCLAYFQISRFIVPPPAFLPIPDAAHSMELRFRDFDVSLPPSTGRRLKEMDD